MRSIYDGHMVTEMITLKLEDTFLEDIGSIVTAEGYKHRTEFIRTALREKVDKVKMNEAMLELAPLNGKSKKKISEQEYETVRQRAFETLR